MRESKRKAFQISPLKLSFVDLEITDGVVKPEAMLAVLGMGLAGNLLIMQHRNNDLPTKHVWNKRRKKET